jgi:GNAT superfamily N-acetyltransferase
MTIEVRRSDADDRAAILNLMEQARGTGLSDEERAQRGFVQGVMDEAALIGFESGTGIFVAVEDGRLAGFAMTAHPSTVQEGPPLLAVQSAQSTAGDQRLFMYGPAAVDPGFQGRGVLTSLLRALSAALRADFDLGVAFVEEANHRSLQVHRHYGMVEVPGFSFQGRNYHVFTFDPAELAVRA